MRAKIIVSQVLLLSVSSVENLICVKVLNGYTGQKMSQQPGLLENGLDLGSVVNHPLMLHAALNEFNSFIYTRLQAALRHKWPLICDKLGLATLRPFFIIFSLNRSPLFIAHYVKSSAAALTHPHPRHSPPPHVFFM